MPGVSPLDKLDFVVWLRFGEDEEFDAGRWGSGDIQQLRQLDFTRFEIIPRDSIFQRRWEGVLLEDGERETFVWRRGYGDCAETYELSLPVGEFTGVLKLAGDWFRDLRSRRVTDEDRAGQGRAVLVRRSEDRRFAGI